MDDACELINFNMNIDDALRKATYYVNRELVAFLHNFVYVIY